MKALIIFSFLLCLNAVAQENQNSRETVIELKIGESFKSNYGYEVSCNHSQQGYEGSICVVPLYIECSNSEEQPQLQCMSHGPCPHVIMGSGTKQTFTAGRSPRLLQVSCNE